MKKQKNEKTSMNLYYKPRDCLTPKDQKAKGQHHEDRFLNALNRPIETPFNKPGSNQS